MHSAGVAVSPPEPNTKDEALCTCRLRQSRAISGCSSFSGEKLTSLATDANSFDAHESSSRLLGRHQGRRDGQRAEKSQSLLRPKTLVCFQRGETWDVEHV